MIDKAYPSKVLDVRSIIYKNPSLTSTNGFLNGYPMTADPWFIEIDFEGNEHRVYNMIIMRTWVKKFIKYTNLILS